MRIGRMKTESWNIGNSLKTRPSEFTPLKLGFFLTNSPKQVITRLGKMSLNPSLTSLNTRRET